MNTTTKLTQRILSFLPAILSIVIVGGLIGRGIYTSRQINNEYRVAARQAIADKKLDKAKFYYSRLVGAGDQGSTQDQFNMVSVLDAAGDTEGARDLLDQLAPNDKVGYAPAHKQKAALLHQFIAKNGVNKPALDTLHWHLRHGARDPSVESDLLWANYYLAVEQVDEAIGRFSAAATRNPDLWFQIAGLYQQIKRPDDAKRARERAEAQARLKLDKDPLDIEQRLRLADILMFRDQVDQVQELLTEGLRLTGQDPAMKRAASNFALLRLKSIGNDQSVAAHKNRFVLLNKAIELDPENQGIYEALSTFYASVDSDVARAAYRKQLQKWITEGISVAYAHFTLGNLLWLEAKQDDAIFHLEKAFEMDSSLVTVANNLAWVLSQAEKPDLDRAEKLIRMAMETNPDNIRFADTFAAVLFAKGSYSEALVQFERVLPMTQGEKRKEVHQKLAEIYEQLDKPEMAASHRDRMIEMERTDNTVR